jgi:hypothetical protein
MFLAHVPELLALAITATVGFIDLLWWLRR